MEIDRLCPQILDLIRQENFLTRNGRIILESPGEQVLQFKGWELAKVLGKEKRGSPCIVSIYLPNPCQPSKLGILPPPRPPQQSQPAKHVGPYDKG